jgi:hypothetical protein
MTQDRNEWIYDALTELSGIDTYDVNLRDHPKAYEVLDRLLDTVLNYQKRANAPDRQMFPGTHGPGIGEALK